MCNASPYPERAAELGITGWHGFTWSRCVVVGETEKRFRIRALNGETLRLAGPRSISGDKTALVPKHAIRFPEAQS